MMFGQATVREIPLVFLAGALLPLSLLMLSWGAFDKMKKKKKNYAKLGAARAPNVPHSYA
jgi:MFS superfamily sulfate permease-like transporter